MQEQSAQTPAETQKISILTKSRQELFNISAILARGLNAKAEHDVLNDPKNPVVIAVDGSFNGGKSIFADAIRRALLSTTSGLALRGELQTEEYWYAKRGKDKLEIDFVNINRSRFAPDYDAADEFLAKRKFGGVSFLHNTETCKNLNPSLQIWLEMCDQHYVDRLRVGKTPLLEEFKRRGNAMWNRYLEIEIKDERLRLSPQFQQAVADIQAGKQAVENAYSPMIASKAQWQERMAKVKKVLSLGRHP